ncbi:MAG: 2-dehydropantoate 2-reductase, partial [Rhodospirillaceae bacterium]|nr:2-dehydropantoate 2-reductase [Rhodospirillaceae bacterium]
MRFLMVGTGGLGGYFGARLHAAGNEVIFCARGNSRAALVENGLT